jgi:hypothetical protein
MEPVEILPPENPEEEHFSKSASTTVCKCAMILC